MDFFKVIQQGEISTVRELIKNDSSVINKIGPTGQSALHLMIKENRFECVEELLRNGADVNVVDGDGKTPLHYVAESEDSDIIHVGAKLIEKGANVDAKDHNENTPLHVTCQKANRIEIAKFLLEHEAYVEAKDSLGMNALMHAAFVGSFWGGRKDPSLWLTLLIEQYGANVLSVSNDLFTPLMYAAACDSVEGIRCLVKYDTNVNAVNKDGESALYLVVQKHSVVDKNRESIELLLKHGTDVNVEVEIFLGLTTPLVAATQGRDTEVMKILLLHGSGLHPSLNRLIGGESIRYPSDVYSDRLLVVAGVFVNRPWRHYFTEYHDVWSPSQVKTPHSDNEDIDSDSSSEISCGDYTEYWCSDTCLRDLCRFKIRCQLMEANPSRNLFYLVPKLNTHLPTQLLDFLLYHFEISEE